MRREVALPGQMGVEGTGPGMTGQKLEINQNNTANLVTHWSSESWTGMPGRKELHVCSLESPHKRYQFYGTTPRTIQYNVALQDHSMS